MLAKFREYMFKKSLILLMKSVSKESVSGRRSRLVTHQMILTLSGICRNLHGMLGTNQHSFIFCARQHICYSAYMLSPVRLFVCLSVTGVDQSKTDEVRIMQLSPQGSPMTLVFPCRTSLRNSKGNTGSGGSK